jgi:hypothetical protein
MATDLGRPQSYIWLRILHLVATSTFCAPSPRGQGRSMEHEAPKRHPRSSHSLRYPAPRLWATPTCSLAASREPLVQVSMRSEFQSHPLPGGRTSILATGFSASANSLLSTPVEPKFGLRRRSGRWLDHDVRPFEGIEGLSEGLASRAAVRHGKSGTQRPVPVIGDPQGNPNPAKKLQQQPDRARRSLLAKAWPIGPDRRHWNQR